MKRWLRRAWGLARDRKGNVMLEFALDKREEFQAMVLLFPSRDDPIRACNLELKKTLGPPKLLDEDNDD